MRRNRSLPRALIFHGIGRPIRKSIKVSLYLPDIWIRAFLKLDHYFNVYLSRLYSPREKRHPEIEAEVKKYYASLGPLVENLPYKPKISVLIPVYKVDPRYLTETLVSVTTQIYPNWEVCIVDDASGDPRIDRVIETFKKAYPDRIRSAVNEKNLHISLTSNRALELATGDYVALLDHDDRLERNALAEVVRYINLRDKPDVIYTDERKIDEEGFFYDQEFLKPGWSPYFHLAVNYTTHLSVYRTEFLREIGGFRAGFEGSQDHDLMLRAVERTTKPVVHVPFCCYQWRAFESSTAADAAVKPYAVEAGIKAVREACERRGKPADVEWDAKILRYRVKFRLPEPNPKVSILIPTKNHRKLLETCINSILQKSTYSNYEIIVTDNGSTEQDALDYLKSIGGKDGRIKVRRDPRPFNFGRLNNDMAREASGEYLILLNNDTEVITPEWIEEMLRYAQFPDVGAVGCKLLYPDGLVQHAGLVGVDRNVAGHGFRLREHNNTSYFNYLQTPHEVLGITAGCLMISREKYLAEGGLDEVYFPNGYGDVEFCLKLRRRGLQNIYTPYAELYHYESPSRGRLPEVFERMTMTEKWGHDLMMDPFLNPRMARGEHYDPEPTLPNIQMSNFLFQEVKAEELRKIGLS